MSRVATAAVVAAPGADFEVTELLVTELRRHEVMVRIDAVGMCHADLAARSGAFPFPLPGVLGHEGTGIVEEVGGAVTGLAPGDRVVLTFDSCGQCHSCLGGHPSQCERFFELNFANGARSDGSTTLEGAGGSLHGNFFGQSSFSTLAIATERNAVKVRDDVPPELLAPLGCGVQTGVGAVLNVLRPRPWESIAVFGMGAVGLSAVMAARAVGVERILVVDVLPAKIELARELGATDAINGAETDVVEALRDLTQGGVAFALECSGVPAVLAQAIASGRSGSTIGVIGVPAFGVTANLDVAEVVNRSKRIQGIDEGDSNPLLFIPQLADMVAAGRLPVGKITRGFQLSEINEAAEQLRAGEVIKPVLSA